MSSSKVRTVARVESFQVATISYIIIQCHRIDFSRLYTTHQPICPKQDYTLCIKDLLIVDGHLKQDSSADDIRGV